MESRTRYDQIISFLNSKQIHLLAVQETRRESVNTFCKSGWEILHSGASDAKHHDVGFLSPLLLDHIVRNREYSTLRRLQLLVSSHAIRSLSDSSRSSSSTSRDSSSHLVIAQCSYNCCSASRPGARATRSMAQTPPISIVNSAYRDCPS